MWSMKHILLPVCPPCFAFVSTIAYLNANIEAQTRTITVIIRSLLLKDGCRFRRRIGNSGSDPRRILDPVYRRNHTNGFRRRVLPQAPRPLEPGDGGSHAHSDFVSAFLLNAANPTTAFSFLAVLATLGVGRERSLWQTSVLVACIFCGSMIWWTILASAARRLRCRITDRRMRWMDHVAGIVIGGFGLVNILLSRGRRH